jgi:hypothetical protein
MIFIWRDPVELTMLDRSNWTTQREMRRWLDAARRMRKIISFACLTSRAAFIINRSALDQCIQKPQGISAAASQRFHPRFSGAHFFDYSPENQEVRREAN